MDRSRLLGQTPSEPALQSIEERQAIQFALDQYELANTRLIEAKQAYKERVNAVVGYVFEAAIIALLGYQIVNFMK